MCSDPKNFTKDEISTETGVTAEAAEPAVSLATLKAVVLGDYRSRLAIVEKYFNGLFESEAYAAGDNSELLVALHACSGEKGSCTIFKELWKDNDDNHVTRFVAEKLFSVYEKEIRRVCAEDKAYCPYIGSSFEDVDEFLDAVRDPYNDNSVFAILYKAVELSSESAGEGAETEPEA